MSKVNTVFLFFVFFSTAVSAQVPGFLGKKNIVELGVESTIENDGDAEDKASLSPNPVIFSHYRFIYERVLGNKFSLTATLSSFNKTIEYTQTTLHPTVFYTGDFNNTSTYIPIGEFKYHYSLFSIQTRFYTGKKASAPLGFFTGFDFRISALSVKKVPSDYEVVHYGFPYRDFDSSPDVPLTNQTYKSISFLMGFRRVLFNTVTIGSLFRIGAPFGGDGKLDYGYARDNYYFFEQALYHRARWGEISGLTVFIGALF